MVPSGDIYGVVLNDRTEHTALADAFGEAPYKAPPQFPVVYIKARSSVACGRVYLPDDGHALRGSPTIALLFGRCAVGVSSREAIECIAAAAVAVDFCIAGQNYYRPDVITRSCDSYLALGDWAEFSAIGPIVTSLDGAQVHAWSLDQLVRDIGTLIADISEYMSLRPGDVLMVGLPGDAPEFAQAGELTVRSGSLPPLTVQLEGRQ